ncbi:free fatty acid receptor 2-like [Astyanax mexicanus]|uniref:Free fatty acid receptor 2-like n=1 Tax=Astyanax mexicanus TaxID=7994 RepID=A0A8T2MPQ6_ASTMX|nr:free fatty acid receptor 2-like [Astyanax mexicanus]
MQWTWLMSDLVLVVYGITLITGLPANLLALYTFVRKVKQNPKPIDVLLLSLTISDLIFLFFLPFRMEEAANMKWTRSYFFCTLTIFVFFAAIYNSTFLLTAISVERYLGVAFPVKYKLKQHPRNAVIASVMFGLISLAHCSIIFITQYWDQRNNTHQDPSTRNICYEDFSHEQLNVLLPVRLELFLVFFCAPFIICCFCYINFILILSRMPTINPKKRFRAIGLALVTLVVFIICFIPFSISHLVGYIGWYNPSWREYALLTSTFNACLDPFIFYFSSSALRQMFKTCARGLVKRLSFCSKAPCCTQQNRATAEEPPSTTLSFR